MEYNYKVGEQCIYNVKPASTMDFKFNDGGRAASNNTGGINDCVTRAISIATGCGYATAKEYLRPIMTHEGVNVFSDEFANIAKTAGLIYVAARNRAFTVSNLPRVGVFIAHTSKHVTTVIDGVIQDTFDTSAEIIQGYWIPRSRKGYNLYKGEELLNLNPLSYDTALRMRDLHNLNYSKNLLLTIRPVC